MYYVRNVVQLKLNIVLNFLSTFRSFEITYHSYEINSFQPQTVNFRITYEKLLCITSLEFNIFRDLFCFFFVGSVSVIFKKKISSILLYSMSELI